MVAGGRRRIAERGGSPGRGTRIGGYSRKAVEWDTRGLVGRHGACMEVCMSGIIRTEVCTAWRICWSMISTEGEDRGGVCLFSMFGGLQEGIARGMVVATSSSEGL